MKVGVLMNVYNEAEWLDCAIASVLGWCDTMVVIEGAYGIAIKAGAPPRSNDGTLKILEKWMSDSKKITLLQRNEHDEAQQLQVGLEVLKSQNVDWYLLVDGDEVWQKNDLSLIRNAMERGDKNGIYQYRVNFLNFINSFDQYYDAVMKRVFKLTPGARAIGQNGLAWPDHGKQCDVGVPQPHISQLPPVVKCYHYTELKAAERWLLKKRYLKVRDGNPRFDAWKVTKDGFQNDEKGIKKFVGRHPDSVKSTDLYKLWERDPELLRKELFGKYE
jgi:glycosyltransferase involved in cell wall biosynthesis